MVKCLNKHFIVITAVMVIGVFGLSATANSQETVETFIPDFAVTCTNTGQLCDPPFSVSVETGTDLKARYFVRREHCSSIRVRIFLDGALRLTTGFFGWPGSPPPFADLPFGTGLIDFGPVSPGTHLISIQGEGQPGGCNATGPVSWGGSLDLFHATAVQVVQVPGQPEVPVPVPVSVQSPIHLCNGLPANIVGDGDGNTLYGTPGNDVIDGLAGNDTIFGLGGNDIICGGLGRDKLYGGSGDDKLYGDAGNDVLKGGAGKDRLFGDSGKDAMDGQSGSDRCNGGSGKDKATRCEKTTRVP